MVVKATQITEKDLIALIRLKRLGSIEALYDTYAKVLFFAIIRIVPKQKIAENILEQTFVAAWYSFDTYSAEKGNLLAWLMKIARKHAIDSDSFVVNNPVLG